MRTGVRVGIELFLVGVLPIGISRAGDPEDFARLSTTLSAQTMARRFQDAEATAKALLELTDRAYRDQPGFQLVARSLVASLY
jgi:hypothetical protein